MLEANKNAIFERIFSIYNRHLLSRRFSSIRVKGLSYLLNKDAKVPLLIYCNHSSWWDGLIAFQVSNKTRLDSFIMMEEKHLKKWPLFRRLGAFSVVRENPKEAYKSIAYASRLLNGDPKRTLWIFPQGEILPNDLRPLKFFNGVSKIVEKVKKCQVVALSIRYEFLGEYKPQIFVKISSPELISVQEKACRKKVSEMFAERLTKNLDELKNNIIYQQLADYTPLF
jgi:chlorobactene lauroyltransferase